MHMGMALTGKCVLTWKKSPIRSDTVNRGPNDERQQEAEDLMQVLSSSYA